MIEPARVRMCSTLQTRKGGSRRSKQRVGWGALILRNEAHLHLNKVLRRREVGREGTNYTNYTKSSRLAAVRPPLALALLLCSVPYSPLAWLSLYQNRLYSTYMCILSSHCSLKFVFLRAGTKLSLNVCNNSPRLWRRTFCDVPLFYFSKNNKRLTIFKSRNN